MKNIMKKLQEYKEQEVDYTYLDSIVMNYYMKNLGN